jgi:RNA polymerase sigma-70 factor (ECF subfamily)
MVRRRQRGSGAELEHIEAVYRARLAEFRRVAAAVTGDRQAALDVVQEAFGAAIRRRETFRGAGELEGWLWRIVVNTARDHVKTAGRRALAETASSSLPSANGTHPVSDALVAEIGLLPERQRLALFLRYYADLEYAAIADVLGIRPGTVAATLNAAHTKLRQRLEEVVR